jgi:hypothetical protein
VRESYIVNEILESTIVEHPTSPSQVDAAGLCWRKWGFNKLDLISSPANAAAQRGTDVHAVLESWLRDAKPINFSTDIGKIASGGLRFLPKPKTQVVEDNFAFRTATSIYRGLKDFKNLRGEPVRKVGDHKTTSDFRWVKDPVKLRRDPQAVIYAVSEIEESRALGVEPERLEMGWVYYLAEPKRPKGLKVLLHILPDERTPIPECPPEVRKEHFGVMYYPELYDNFSRHEGIAAQMLRYHQEGAKGADLPYNASACQAFGGCPYRNNPCVLTVRQRVQSMEDQLTNAVMSLAEKMRASMEGKTAPDPVTAASKTPTSSGAIAPSDMAKRLAGALKREAPARVNPPEQSKGTDPDALASASSEKCVVSPADRMEMTARMADALLGGTFNRQVYESPPQLAAAAVAYADAILLELSK